MGGEVEVGEGEPGGEEEEVVEGVELKEVVEEEEVVGVVLVGEVAVEKEAQEEVDEEVVGVVPVEGEEGETHLPGIYVTPTSDCKSCVGIEAK